MKRSAIVTGGAGFVGSHLVERLLDESWDVLVVDDLSTGSMSNLQPAKQLGRFKTHVMDIRAPEFVEVVERAEPEVIFHLAAHAKVRPSVTDPMHDASVNVLGTINVLHAAAEAGSRRVVFASSGGAIYGGSAKLPVTERTAKRPESPYGISKKVVQDYFEWFHEARGLEYVMLAFANIYGPRQDPGLEGGVVAIFSKAMLEGRRPVIYGDGKQTRDFVYVEDAVDALHRAVEKGNGRLLNIGSGSETSVLELYDAVAAATGFRKKPEFADAKPGEVLRSVVDASAARKALGWEPWTPLDTGLRHTIDWYRS